MEGRGSESALYEVVCPVFYLSRLFGQAPYVYPKNNQPPRLQPSLPNCFYTVIWILFHSYNVFVALVRFGQVQNKPILGVTETGKMILNYIVLVVDMAMGIVKRDEFVELWNSISEFDETNQLGVPVKGKHIRYGPVLMEAKRWLWSILFISIVGWTAVNQLGMLAFDEPYIQNISYMLFYVGTYIAAFKFCGLVFLLGQRFAYLNELVTEMMIIKNQRYTLIDMKKIQTEYNKLINTSEKLDNIYSLSLFLFLFNMFCHIISNMYFLIYWTIIDSGFWLKLDVISCELTWLIMFLIQLLLISVTCHITSREANRMGQLFLNWSRQADRLSRKTRFKSTLHFLNSKLQFTAAGCFKVDLQLLTATFGHITTYLVILLQLPVDDEDD